MIFIANSFTVKQKVGTLPVDDVFVGAFEVVENTEPTNSDMQIAIHNL